MYYHAAVRVHYCGLASELEDFTNDPHGLVDETVEDGCIDTGGLFAHWVGLGWVGSMGLLDTELCELLQSKSKRKVLYATVRNINAIPWRFPMAFHLNT